MRGGRGKRAWAGKDTLRPVSDRTALITGVSGQDGSYLAELLLAADVVVTDYSSLMFDVTATSTPLVLFAPDREHYERELRGFYFDLLAEAPVVVTENRAALIAELARLAESGGGEAPSEAMQSWRHRFTALDDGAAAERVVARLIAAGMLDAA